MAIEYCAICGWPLIPGSQPLQHEYGLRLCKTRPPVNPDEPEFRDRVFASRTPIADEVDEVQP